MIDVSKENNLGLEIGLNETLKYTQAEMKMKLNNQVTEVKLKRKPYK